MSKIDELLALTRTLRLTTEPAPDHTDPASIDDCWDELEGLVKKQQARMSELEGALQENVHDALLSLAYFDIERPPIADQP